MPQPPDTDFILDRVKGSNNSCPGPDGNHFSFLKVFPNKFTSAIKLIINHISSGLPPPNGFNEVLQYFIPKALTYLVRDTRPISVGNAVNRIIAKVLVDLLTPAAQAILGTSQKGFVPGRQGKDHIEGITQEFYSKLSKKKQLYILFLDTEKAFDSLHHDFIFKVLEKIKCPIWFINSYKALLDNVVGIPVLSGPTKTRIRIKRGVKQGCPLSPIIFAICYDVLLVKLSKSIHSDHKDYAFADDLAISSESPLTIMYTPNSRG
jgi:hypothetical protein